MYKPKFTPEIYHLMSVFVKLFPMHFFAYVIIVSCYSDPTAWGLGEGPTTGHRKKKTARYEMLHRALELAGSCEHGNEPSGSIKGGEFLDKLSDC
jgi:hypothetical protein